MSDHRHHFWRNAGIAVGLITAGCIGLCIGFIGVPVLMASLGFGTPAIATTAGVVATSTASVILPGSTWLAICALSTAGITAIGAAIGGILGNKIDKKKALHNYDNDASRVQLPAREMIPRSRRYTPQPASYAIDPPPLPTGITNQQPRGRSY